jgi:hypothetical protein
VICQFPLCGYQAQDTSELDVHHILSLKDGGTNAKYNLLVLCPSCHRRIYAPTATHGLHTIKRENSILVRRKIPTSSGEGLLYQRMDGKDRVWIQKTGEDYALEENLPL